jgi:triosephosphate isomerase
MIFVNFKTYEQGSGKNALNLVKILQEVAHERQIKVIPVVQAIDLKDTVESTTLEVWAQHVDPIEYGAHTGQISPQEILEAGAAGTFLNHSEKKFSDLELLKKANEMVLSLGLKTLIFASGIDELQRVLPFKPTFVSYEPPELIGSRDVSVATQKPEIIEKAHELAQQHSIPLIVGAGIHSKDDIKISLQLGATGFAIASDILKAEDPKKEILELMEGYNQ